MSRPAVMLPVVVIPDEQSWAAWGVDLEREGVRPVFAPAAARGVVAPGLLPDVLAAPLARYRERLAADAGMRELAPVMAAADAPPEHDGGHGHGDTSHDGDEDADHGDMMAIVGDPSADGLVMESMDVVYGPLATPLPGGLVVSATLDGDVVAESHVSAMLVATQAQDRPMPADLLSPIAWNLAIRDAGAGVADGPAGWSWIAAVEIERAVSHTAWLRSFARLLGWRRPVNACTDALSSLLTARGQAIVDLEVDAPVEAPASLADALSLARVDLTRLRDLVAGSRSLRLRLAGIAPITRQEVDELGLRGPPARACGGEDDARIGDDRYGALGFEPVVGEPGDALARTVVRASEAVVAVDMALGAHAAVVSGAELPASPTRAGASLVEGPRGPLRARRTDDGWRLTAPGAEPALCAAQASMVGREWSSALATLASFDLSAWRMAS